MAIWTHSHAPSSTKDIVGQDAPVGKVLDFLANFPKTKRKGIIIYGDTGCGKTSSVHAICQEKGYEVVEVNASDVRNKDAIQQRIGQATQQMSLFAKSKVILIDEIDGISGTKDRGGLQAVEKIITSSAFPIIATGVDPWDKKFSGLRKACEMISFNSLTHTDIQALLERISEAEGIAYEDMAIKGIARRAGGDARAAVNDLQLLSAGQRITKDDLDMLGDRNRTEKMKDALFRVFKTTDANVARGAFDNTNSQPDEIMLWLDQNLPKEYTRPADLAAAYDRMSRADVFMGRIRRRQHWRFLVHIHSLLSAGVATAKEEKYKTMQTYEETKRILMLWRAKMKYKKRDAIAQKVADQTHLSLREARASHMPYLPHLLKQDPSIAEWLELNDDEQTWVQQQ